MFKSMTIGAVKIGDRMYQLLCAPDSPLGELHDALMQMKGHCVDKMIEAHKQEQEAVKAQEQQSEEAEPASQE